MNDFLAGSCKQTKTREVFTQYIWASVLFFPNASPIGMAIAEEVLFEDCEKKPIRQQTQRHGHGMMSDRWEDDGLIALQLVHFFASKSIPKRLLNRFDLVGLQWYPSPILYFCTPYYAV